MNKSDFVKNSKGKLGSIELEISRSNRVPVFKNAEENRKRITALNFKRGLLTKMSEYGGVNFEILTSVTGEGAPKLSFHN